MFLSLLLVTSPARAATDLFVNLQAQINGRNVTYAVTVCNKGQKSGPFFTGLYYDRTQAPACKDLPDHQLSFPSLGKNNCQTEMYVRANVPLGQHDDWVFADNSCVINEPNEGDNLAHRIYSIAADLTITGFIVDAKDTSVTYEVTVTNEGVATGAPFKVGLFFDRLTAPACADTPEVVLDFASLILGQSATQAYTRSSVPLGSYSAWALADQSCVIFEKDEQNNAASSDYAVGPNLVVTSPVITVAGSTVTYAVDVCNWSSSEDVGLFAIKLWYDLATAPTCVLSGNAAHTWNESSLARGSCKTLTHTRSGAASGSYRAYFFADPACALTESREDDNIRSATYEIGASLLPDLYPASFSATISGADVLYQTTICNQGSAVTSSFEVGLFYNQTAAPACGTADHTWVVNGMGTSLCQSLTYTAIGAASASVHSWVLADASCAITEASEDNNNLDKELVIGEADVLVSSFSASVDGNHITYNMMICNTGDSIVDPFSVGLFYDQATTPSCLDGPDQSTEIKSLPAGACLSLSLSQQGAAMGPKLAWVLADNLCQLDEGNETNNTRQYAFTVGEKQADLRLAPFTILVEENQVSFTLTACNISTVAAPASTIGLIYNHEDPPSCGVDADWQVTLAALPAGECSTREHKLLAVGHGLYQAWAGVDLDCAVGESNEENNWVAQVYNVLAPGVDLQVTALTGSVLNWRTTLLATICNVGHAPAPVSTTGLFYRPHSFTPLPCADAPEISSALLSLEATQCTTQSWVIEDLAPGTYTVWALADTSCHITESDESNNAFTYQLTVEETPGSDGSPQDGSIAEGGAAPASGESGCSCHASDGAGSAGSHGYGLLLLVLLLLAGRWRGRD